MGWQSHIRIQEDRYIHTGYPEHFQSSQKTKIMKSIKESIIGRKGVSGKLRKFGDLKYGDIVVIDMPDERKMIDCIYVPEYITMKVISYSPGPTDNFGRFISIDINGRDIIYFRADKFVNDFPDCPEDDEDFYSKITNKIGHTEEYVSLEDKKDVISLFKKYNLVGFTLKKTL